MYVFAIYDKVAREMGPLFEGKNDEIAERMVTNALKELINPHEQSLYRLGSIEHDCDQKMSCIVPEFDCVMSDLSPLFPVSVQEKDLKETLNNE